MKDAQVRQFTIALIGDMAKNSPDLLNDEFEFFV